MYPREELRTAPRPVTVFLRLSSNGTSLGDQWLAIGCAAILGFNHANAKYGGVVPSLAELPSDSPKLSVFPFDTKDTLEGGVAAYRSANSVGATNAVGPARSGVAVPLAILGSIGAQLRTHYS